MLKVPTKNTLKKYGISFEEWNHLADSQGRVCAICKGLPKSGSGILHIDHHHVKKWRKMEPKIRKLYIRGLACFRCNSQFIRRGLTTELAKSVWEYLQKYEINKKEEK